MEQGLTHGLSGLASSGVLGMLVVVLLYAYWQKDRELYSLQREVINAITKLADVVAFIEKREHSHHAPPPPAPQPPYRGGPPGGAA